jgi:hypothetical protein
MTRGGAVPYAMQTHQLATCAGSWPRQDNVALLSRAAVKSPSSPTVQHANSTRGTKATPTTISGLRLVLNVAGSPRARKGESPPNYSEKAPDVPK